MFMNHAHIIPPQVRPDGGIAPFLEMAARLGLEGAVCFAPFSYQVAGTGIRPNRWLARQIVGETSLCGFGTLDPTRPPAEQVREIADLGFKGVKLHPAAQNFSVFGDWAKDAYGELVKYDLIADFHTGIHWHRIAEYSPVLFDEAAHFAPQLRMIFEHVGGWHYFREMVAVIVNNQRGGNRLYAGIASVLDAENQRYWYLGPEGMRDLQWQIGADLMIYGMDYPYNQAPQIERDVAILRGMDLSARDIEAILGGNLKRLLGLEAGSEEPRTVGGDPN